MISLFFIGGIFRLPAFLISTKTHEFLPCCVYGVSFVHTNSIFASSALRAPRLPRRVMRVYPPERLAYFGARSVWSFLTTSRAFPRQLSSARRDCNVSLFAMVTNFSTNGRISFAFATVVVMEPRNTRERVRERSKAVCCFFTRPNVRPFLWCLIPNYGRSVKP